MPTVTGRKTSIQYDGTNGAFIAGTWDTGIGFVSDTGTVLTYSDRDNAHQTADLNQWLIVNSVDDGYPIVMDTVEYQVYFAEIPDAQSLKLAAGYALTPTILTTASANVAVNLDAAMTGTGYEFTAVLAGAANLLGALQITGAVATDSDTVTVTVQNTGLLSLAGATVIVAAAQLV